MAKKQYVRGENISKHGSVVQGAEHLVRALSRLPDVRKVTNAHINSKGGKTRRAHVEEIQGGVKVTVTSNGAKQCIFVYFNRRDPNAVDRIQRIIAEYF